MQIYVREDMTSDDKKSKKPAPKNETPAESKSTSGPDPAKVEAGEIGAAVPSGYTRGGAKNRFLKPIRITGT
jgi:hypothetical protein